MMLSSKYENHLEIALSIAIAMWINLILCVLLPLQVDIRSDILDIIITSKVRDQFSYVFMCGFIPLIALFLFAKIENR